MATNTRFAVALLVGFAVFVIFASPLTIGPPAPLQKQKRLPLLVLLAIALSAWVLQLVRDISVLAFCTSIPVEQRSTSERLSLVCTRLC
jgi:hypothetical protein